MYKEEKIINGILHYRTSPNADFKPYTLEDFTGIVGMLKEVAKQQERSYSEEDMIATFHYGHQIGMNSVLAIQSQHSPQPIEKPDLDKLKSEWFEQFKNK